MSARTVTYTSSRTRLLSRMENEHRTRFSRRVGALDNLTIRGSETVTKPLASMMGPTSCSDIMAIMRETSQGVKNWPILVFSLRLFWSWFPRHLL